MFVRSENPIWYFVDLQGVQLDDTYFIFFLQNTLPYLPQAVYQDPAGLFPWSDPIQFYPNGTLPDNIYFNNTLVYRLEIRKGNTQTAPLVYEINNYIPGGGASPPPEDVVISTGNQISNGQFSQISFVSPLTITTAGTYEVAPGWFLALVGTGTAIVTQNIFAANSNIIGMPPFGLTFNLSGSWTSAIFYQRFMNNGGIWTSTTAQPFAIATSLTAEASGSSYNLSVFYAQSDAGITQLLAQGTITVDTFQVLQNAIQMPVSTDTDLNSVAYWDYQIVLQPTGTITITNVQVVGQDTPVVIPYEQETIERQRDYLFHFYSNELITKPKRNILVGWNFPQNPYQFESPTLATVTNQIQYIADQTILFQQAAASTVGAGKASAANRYGLEIQAVNGALVNQFAIIQYIDPISIRPYWSDLLSMFARMRIFTSHGTQVPVKARLIWRTTVPPLITSTEPISSWTSGGDPVFAAGWTALKPLNDPAYILPNAYSAFETPSGSAFPGFAFDQFQMPDASTATMSLGVVLYTTANMNQTSDSLDSIVFDRISLVPNKFGVDASPETFDEVLHRCQFYFEKSYNNEVAPGTASAVGCVSLIMGATSASLLGMDRPFKSAKRITPVTVWYSTNSGSPNRVYNITTSSDVIVNSIALEGKTSTGIPVVNAPILDTSLVQAQWSANALMGQGLG